MFELFDPGQQAKAAHYIHAELKNDVADPAPQRSRPRRTLTQTRSVPRLRQPASALAEPAILKASRLQIQSGTHAQLFSQTGRSRPRFCGEGAGSWQHGADGYRPQDGAPLSPESW
jgi:hypothetical protein